jgi:TDG/mug DNA glycosylase family protein
MKSPDMVLPDVLGPGLKVVFCGSAVGSASARVGAYYAGPGNKFWPTLQRIGLTPRRLAPAEFRSVVAFGIGLTDLCKSLSGADRALTASADDVAGLAAKRTAWAKRAIRAALHLGRGQPLVG